MFEVWSRTIDASLSRSNSNCKFYVDRNMFFDTDSFILQRLHNTRTSSSSLSLGSTGAALNMYVPSSASHFNNAHAYKLYSTGIRSYIPTLAGGFASYSSSKEGQDYSQGTSIVTESEEHVIVSHFQISSPSSSDV
jgi:hypothetical protein